jgi:hypothetical protein
MKPEYSHTIDLFEILHEPRMVDELSRLMRVRALRKVFLNDDRPDGLRLSQDCPVRRVKQYFDPQEWTVPFDQGVATRGFFVEDLVEVYLDEHVPDFDVQTPIRFPLGESAFDFTQTVDGRTYVHTVKSAFTKPNPKPSAANIRQELRMVYCAHVYAVMPIRNIRWHMVDNAFRDHMYTLEIDDIDLSDTHNEMQNVQKAVEFYSQQKKAGKKPAKFTGWDDPEYWVDKFGLQARSNPFLKPDIDATAEVENMIRKYIRAREVNKTSERELDELKNELKPLVIERLAKNGETSGTVKAYTEAINLRISKSGSLTITPRKESEVSA